MSDLTSRTILKAAIQNLPKAKFYCIIGVTFCVFALIGFTIGIGKFLIIWLFWRYDTEYIFGFSCSWEGNGVWNAICASWITVKLLNPRVKIYTFSLLPKRKTVNETAQATYWKNASRQFEQFRNFRKPLSIAKAKTNLYLNYKILFRLN